MTKVIFVMQSLFFYLPIAAISVPVVAERKMRQFHAPLVYDNCFECSDDAAWHHF